MIWTAFLVDHPAAPALNASVARIDINDRNSGELRLVRDAGAEMPKGPVVQACSLTAAGRDPAPDVLEVFKHNPASGAFGGLNKRLRNAMVRDLLESALSAGQLSEPPLGCLGTATLKPRPATGEFGADTLNITAGMNYPIAIGGERYDAEVYAEPIISVELVSLGNVTCRGEHPLAAHLAQIDLAFTVGHQRALPVAHHNRNRQPSLNGPDADGAVFREANDAVVVGLSSIAPENWRLQAIDFESVGNLCNAPNGGLGRQAEPLSDVGVCQLVEVELSEGSILEPGRSEPSASLVASGERHGQGGSLFAGRFQFNCRD